MRIPINRTRVSGPRKTDPKLWTPGGARMSHSGKKKQAIAGQSENEMDAEWWNLRESLQLPRPPPVVNVVLRMRRIIKSI